MKRKLFLLFALLSALLLLSACNDSKKPVYHTVTFNSNGAEEFQSRAIEDGNLIIEPQVPTRAGYTFLGWYNGDTKWDFDSMKVTSSITLTANWARITYTVKFDSNGGSPVEEQIVESGNFAVKPADPTKENSRFIGWYNGNEEWYFNATRVVDYVTLVAKWEDHPTYTVIFDSNGGTSVPSQYIIDGYKISEPTPPTKQNSKFLGWYEGDTLWNFNANTLKSNIVLTAKWEEIPTYTVTFNSNGGSAVPPQHIAQGETAIKPSTPDRTQLSKFLGWYLGDQEWDFSKVITSDITLVAKWQNIYKISFNHGDESLAYIVYVNEGNTIPKQPEPTKENSRFIGWFNGEIKWNFTTDIPTSDISLVAKWEVIPTHTITFDSDGGSAISAQYVLDGNYLREPGVPTKSGYRFDGWYLGDTKWNFNTDKVSGHITLKAKWIEIVTVVFYSNDGTFINPSLIDKGQPVQRPQDPTRNGYAFRGWQLPDGTTWDFNTAVTSDMTLQAKWVKIYTITFDTDGAGEIAPIIVDEGEKITKPQKPSKGKMYLFDAWINTETNTPWNFETDTVTKDITLKARWILILPPDTIK